MSGWRLYADAGNTALKWAVHAQGRWVAEGRLEVDALPAARSELAGVLALAGFDPDECEGAALVSSRPGQAAEAEEALVAGTGQDVRLLGRDLHAEIEVAYHDPSEIGQDRLALAEGALELAGAPVIVLALGTCITAQALDAEGTLVGGAIAGGLEAHVAGIGAAVPHLREAVDAALELLRSRETPPRIGRSTVENLASGLAASLTGTVEALVEMMQRRQAGSLPHMSDECAVEVGEAPVLVTGGDAELVGRLIGELRQAGSPPHMADCFDRVEPRLVLEGLRVIDERARDG